MEEDPADRGHVTAIEGAVRPLADATRAEGNVAE
jgi:hypothetical protein